jgi:hypothetical protein
MRTKLWRLFQAIRVLVVRAGPRVRIHLPPARSLLRTCLLRSGRYVTRSLRPGRPTDISRAADRSSSRSSGLRQGRTLGTTRGVMARSRATIACAWSTRPYGHSTRRDSGMTGESLDGNGQEQLRRCLVKPAFRPSGQGLRSYDGAWATAPCLRTYVPASESDSESMGN